MKIETFAKGKKLQTTAFILDKKKFLDTGIQDVSTRIQALSQVL